MVVYVGGRGGRYTRCGVNGHGEVGLTTEARKALGESRKGFIADYSDNADENMDLLCVFVPLW